MNAANKGNIFITGVTGFIGKAMAIYFSENGFNVHGSSHRKKNLDSPEFEFLKSCHEIRFDSPVSSSPFASCDVVIHCALDISPNTISSNIEGTKRIYEAAKAADVRHQVFISSHSARSDAVSDYGIIKYRLENFFLSQKQTIVRPGLVAGNGGLFLRQYHKISKLRIIPLPDRGKAPVPLISTHDLNKALQKIAENELRGSYNLFYANSPDMKSFVETIKRYNNQPFKIINIPTYWLSPVISFLDKVHFPKNRLTNSLKTMWLNLKKNIHLSDMDKFIISDSSLDIILTNLNF